MSPFEAAILNTFGLSENREVIPILEQRRYKAFNSSTILKQFAILILP